jgi:hypothetical protein
MYAGHWNYWTVRILPEEWDDIDAAHTKYHKDDFSKALCI